MVFSTPHRFPIQVKKHTFSVAQRAAIWTAWKKRCAYTGEMVSFRNLEIDHVIPEELSRRPDELAAIRERLGLPGEFAINSFWNWVPAAHDVNRQKSARQFNDSDLRYYLDRARTHYPTVIREFERLQRDKRSERHLTGLAKLIEEGALRLQDVVEFIQSTIRIPEAPTDDPLVITLGVSADVLQDAVFYGPTCDDMEERLFTVLRSKLVGFVAQTEPSERSGETLSVRFAVWHAPLDAVLFAIDGYWDLLEVARFSDVYPGSRPGEFYADAIAARKRLGGIER